MNKFKIGDKAVALTNSTGPYAQPRVKGNVYDVLDVFIMSCCGRECINITPSDGKLRTVNCNTCNVTYEFGDKMWTDAGHFEKPQRLTAKQDKFLEEENLVLYN